MQYSVFCKCLWNFSLSCGDMSVNYLKCRLQIGDMHRNDGRECQDTGIV